MRRLRLALIAFIAVAAVFPPAARPATAPGAPASQFSTRIANDARVKAAFQWIDSHRAEHLREWIKITEIPAPSKLEQDRSKYIEEQLRAFGLDSVSRDSIGNLI